MSIGAFCYALFMAYLVSWAMIRVPTIRHIGFPSVRSINLFDLLVGAFLALTSLLLVFAVPVEAYYKGDYFMPLYVAVYASIPVFLSIGYFFYSYFLVRAKKPTVKIEDLQQRGELLRGNIGRTR